MLRLFCSVLRAVITAGTHKDTHHVVCTANGLKHVEISNEEEKNASDFERRETRESIVGVSSVHICKKRQKNSLSLAV